MRRKTTKILLAVVLVLTAMTLPGPVSTAATAATQHGHGEQYPLDAGHYRDHTWHSERDGNVRLHVNGESHSHLDVHVYDEHGTEIANNDRNSHSHVFPFHAEREENYVIRVSNKGHRRCRYGLRVG